ncbi:hydrogenase iron-sulfur subunit, partial [Candidatus Bathyarchaeota archaeon]|nr:hydrogenase iron-sulfur subunit [Candidatus Bathyarchaeota archaeon]
QWSDFSALDDPNSVFKDKNAMTLEIPCFKSLDPVHIINALQCGFDGVMGIVCSPEDCKLEEGRDVADRNLEVLRTVLKKMNLIDRFAYCEASPRCASELNQKIDDFYKKLSILSQCCSAKGEEK